VATEVTVVIRLGFEDPNVDELLADIEAIEYIEAVEFADIQEV
jgi:hypothetical protein